MTLSSRISLSALRGKDLARVAAHTGLRSSGTKDALSKRLPIELHSQLFGPGTQRILSIDMGLRNLAYCLVEVDAARFPAPKIAPQTSQVLATSMVKGNMKAIATAQLEEVFSSPASEPPSVLPAMQLCAWYHKDLTLGGLPADELYDPPTLAPVVYNLVRNVLLPLQPTHVIVERQRHRTGGQASILEWTFRVNMLESMLWSSLETLRLEQQQDATTSEEAGKQFMQTHSILPGRVNALLLSEGDRKTADAKVLKTAMAAAWLRSDQLACHEGQAYQMRDEFLAAHKAGSKRSSKRQIKAANDAREDKLKGADGVVEAARKQPVLQAQKLDDLADCLLQVVAWVQWEANRRNVIARVDDKIAMSSQDGGRSGWISNEHYWQKRAWPRNQLVTRARDKREALCCGAGRGVQLRPPQVQKAAAAARMPQGGRRPRGRASRFAQRIYREPGNAYYGALITALNLASGRHSRAETRCREAEDHGSGSQSGRAALEQAALREGQQGPDESLASKEIFETRKQAYVLGHSASAFYFCPATCGRRRRRPSPESPRLLLHSTATAWRLSCTSVSNDALSHPGLPSSNQPIAEHAAAKMARVCPSCCARTRPAHVVRANNDSYHMCLVAVAAACVRIPGGKPGKPSHRVPLQEPPKSEALDSACRRPAGMLFRPGLTRATACPPASQARARNGQVGRPSFASGSKSHRDRLSLVASASGHGCVHVAPMACLGRALSGLPRERRQNHAPARFLACSLSNRAPYHLAALPSSQTLMSYTILARLLYTRSTLSARCSPPPPPAIASLAFCSPSRHPPERQHCSRPHPRCVTTRIQAGKSLPSPLSSTRSECDSRHQRLGASAPAQTATVRTGTSTRERLLKFPAVEGEATSHTGARILRWTEDDRPYAKVCRFPQLSAFPPQPLQQLEPIPGKVSNDPTGLSRSLLHAHGHLGNLKFTQINRRPSPDNPDIMVTTKVATTFSMAEPMARNLCSKFLSARLIEQVGAQFARDDDFASMSSIWQMTPKGIKVLEGFAHRNGVSSEKVTDILKSARNSMNLLVLERKAEQDDLKLDPGTIDVIFRRFAGQSGPNNGSSNGSVHSDSDSIDESSTGLTGVRQVLRKHNGTKLSVRAFSGKQTIDWLMNCCTLVDVREACHIARAMLTHGLISLRYEEKKPARDQPMIFNNSKTAWYEITEDGKKVAKWVTGRAAFHDVLAATSDGAVLANSRENAHRRLATIIGTPGLLIHFREYLIDTHCEENLNFWIEARAFMARWGAVLETHRAAGQDIGSDVLSEILAAAYDLYNAFLAPGSPCELNIEHALRKAFVNKMSQFEVPEDEKREAVSSLLDLYDQAQGSVFKLMASDSAPKFCRDPRYKPYLSEHNLGDILTKAQCPALQSTTVKVQAIST
ncbi:hypothetical protein FH972_026303 [Carpinus fangiana]|uniref:SAP domain-containing protein n=1 Tax=Carpinus fangiana TaxID=176857 RepID=A0A5N6L3K2_9ROSI|nr:hypothetical protein FH972_026303 [Carpinus fangiana]